MRGQVAFKILRRIHRVDGVLDGAGLGVQTVLRFVPNADDEQRVERDRLPLHQRMNFLLLLFHHRQQRDFLFTGVVAGHAVMFLFLLVDFLGDGQRINVDGDGVVQQPEIGEALDDAGIGRARPARERDDGVIMAVQIKPEIALAVALAVPAIFLNRKFRHKILGGVKIKPVGQRRIEKLFVVFEMVEVGHRQHARAGAGENFLEQMVDVRELGLQLVEQRQVILAQGRVAGEQSWACFPTRGTHKKPRAAAGVCARPSPASNARTVRCGNASSRHFQTVPSPAGTGAVRFCNRNRRSIEPATADFRAATPATDRVVPENHSGRRWGCW